MKSWKKLFGAAVSAFALLLPTLPAMGAAQSDPLTPPPNGTTKDQPFPAGAGGSEKFRIPAIVTLNDGTLVAATDARWNTYFDGGGLDTIVSRSHDGGGKNWSYTFANYLGDHGNQHDKRSTAFIDPALATDGETVYMIVDLFPAGYALNGANKSPQKGAEFDEKGNLKLAKREAPNKYDHYLDLQTYQIHKNDGTPVNDYKVTDRFVISQSDGSQSKHLFAADSPFQVFPTNYLYLTSSTDQGATWSAPKLIRAKEANEQTLIIGPGTGTVLKDGTLMFSAYEHTNGFERAVLLWSKDKGQTWHRSADVGNFTSSEATVVQLSDTKVRQFYREPAHATLRYTDYTLTGDKWVPGQVVDTQLPRTARNQIAAIELKDKVNGKRAIALSTATGAGTSRTSGVIYVGLLNADFTMDWRYKMPVTKPGAHYGYSSITQLKDGSIGLLYESGATAETFATFPLDKVISLETDLRVQLQDVELMADIQKQRQQTFTDYAGDYTATDLKALDQDVATATLKAIDAPIGANVGIASGFTGAKRPLPDLQFTFTKQSSANGESTYAVSGVDAAGTPVYLAPNAAGASGFPVAAQQSENVKLSAGHRENTVYVRGAATSGRTGSYVYFDRTNFVLDRVNNHNNREDWKQNTSWEVWQSLAQATANSAPASAENRAAANASTAATIPGFVRVTQPVDLANGKYLLVQQVNNDFYILAPSADQSSKRAQVAKLNTAKEKATQITFTGVKPGKTMVQIGDIYYRITVKSAADLATKVDLQVGAEKTLRTENAGSNPQIAELAEKIAKVQVTEYPALEVDEANLAVEKGGYTVTKNTDDTFTFKGTTAAGKEIYLDPTGQGIGFPFNTQAVKLTIAQGALPNTFSIFGSEHFLVAVKDKWDRARNGYENQRSVQLYRAVKAGEEASALLPGWKQITDIAELADGVKVLVVADNAGQPFALYPSDSTANAFAHAPKINSAGIHELKITGVKPGKTLFSFGREYYQVTVTDANQAAPADPDAQSNPDAQPNPGVTPPPGETPNPGDTANPDAQPNPGEMPNPGETPKPGDTVKPGATPTPGSHNDPQLNPADNGVQTPPPAPQLADTSAQATGHNLARTGFAGISLLVMALALPLVGVGMLRVRARKNAV